MTVARSELMGKLSAAGSPFVRALVVRAQPPAPAHAGDEAVVLEDGSIEGFVGGQCVEESVKVAALGALADGEPVLLRVVPGGGAAFPEGAGSRVMVNPCLSGGSLEIFLEPHLPAPLVAVVGETPIAEAVAALAQALGFSAEAVPTLAGHRPRQAQAAVVATHGHDEPESIRAALDAGVAYVGLVASRRRGEAVLDSMNLAADERARVHTPAGLDIGARTPPEVALSIMAEVVRELRVRRQGRQAAVGPPGARPPATEREAVDPVCGMVVAVTASTPRRSVGGDDVWFCSAGCRDAYSG